MLLLKRRRTQAMVRTSNSSGLETAGGIAAVGSGVVVLGSRLLLWGTVLVILLRVARGGIQLVARNSAKPA